MPSKFFARDVENVPAALSADEAAAAAYAADQGLTNHHFTPGEHPVVRIEHLNKSFDDTKVLKDVNLNVWPGEVVVVLGPSGSGKSTMLRCINLLETPSAGHILIEDEEITGKSAADVNKLRRDVGMVFQQFNLFPHLTAKENVMIGQVKVLKKSTEITVVLLQFSLSLPLENMPHSVGSISAQLLLPVLPRLGVYF